MTPTAATDASSVPITGGAAHLAIQSLLAELEDSKDQRDTWREFTQVALAELAVAYRQNDQLARTCREQRAEISRYTSKQVRGRAA